MEVIYPNWQAPKHVRAFTTTRTGGFSGGQYASNNMSIKPMEDKQNALYNRKAMARQFNLPKDPAWLNQTHSTRYVMVDETVDRNADAAISRQANHPLAIMTADCLPILLCNPSGTEIAAIHAGWRGLVDGVIQNTLSGLKSPMQEMMAWIGPAICSRCFEVGEEVIELFTDRNAGWKRFIKKEGASWYVDLVGIAIDILAYQGVEQTSFSSFCSKEDKKRFYSYRRDGETGRMASIIWFNQGDKDENKSC